MAASDAERESPVPATSAIPFTRDSAVSPLAIAYSAAIDEALTAAAWLRRFRCGLGGHDMLLQFQPGRLSLRCARCGQQTPGWNVNAD